MKRTAVAVVAAMMLWGGPTAHADVIEHAGDRYVIHVDEMELTGEESLAEVLAMCPEVVDMFERGISLAVGTNSFSLVNHNMSYAGDVDVEQFLTKTKAKEIELIDVCNMSGTMKGTEGLQKIIDVYFKKGANGTSGRVSVKADSYGTLKTYNTVKVERDDLTVWGQLMGGLRHRKVNRIETHDGYEAAVAGFDWKINSKNKLMVQLGQNYAKTKVNRGEMVSHDRYIDLNIIYNAELSESGATMEIQTVYAHTGSNSYSDDDILSYRSHLRSNIPVGVAEFYVPLVKDRLSVIAGIEGGSGYDDFITDDYSNNTFYYDLYAQLDWNFHGVNFCLGDRVRTQKYFQHENENYHGTEGGVIRSFGHRHRNHFFNFCVYGNITKHSVLKGSFAKSPVIPSYVEYYYKESYDQDYYNYYSRLKKLDAYVSELRYEYQKPDFIFSAFVNNSHTNYYYHENTFQIGASTFWHKGAMRLSAAINYYNVMDYGRSYSNIVQLRLQPAFSLQAGWRIVPQLNYTSFCRYYETDMPSHLSASLTVTKTIGKWDFDLIGNNLAHQRYGRRSVALGVTYNW